MRPRVPLMFFFKLFSILLISMFSLADTLTEFSDTGSSSSKVDVENGGQVAQDGNISTSIDSFTNKSEVDNDVFSDMPFGRVNPDGTQDLKPLEGNNVNLGSNNTSLNTVSTQELGSVISGSGNLFNAGRKGNESQGSQNGGSPVCGANGLVLGASCAKSNNEKDSGNGGNFDYLSGNFEYGTNSHQFQTGANPTIGNTGVNGSSNGGSNIAANAAIEYGNRGIIIDDPTTGLDSLNSAIKINP